VDLGRLAQAVLEHIRDSDPDRVIQFVLTDSLRVHGDSQLLRVLLENLIGNAWKFSSKRAAATIEVGSESEVGSQVFFVRDNGAGFDMAYADRCSCRFSGCTRPTSFQAQASVSRRSSNYRASRRRIWADGKVGQGATFRFTLADATHEGP